MAKGDIVLITFPFTDLSGSKLRPAAILAESGMNLTVCFITTQIGWQEPTDILLAPKPANGLRKQSLIRTGKIATLDRSLAKGLLGKLSIPEIVDLNSKLKVLCYLNYPKKCSPARARRKRDSARGDSCGFHSTQVCAIGRMKCEAASA